MNLPPEYPNTNQAMSFQQVAVDPKVAMATEYAPLQEYLLTKGFEYHPVTKIQANPELKGKTDLEKSLDNFTDVDVLDDDNRFICYSCNREDSTYVMTNKRFFNTVYDIIFRFSEQTSADHEFTECVDFAY